MRKFLLVLLILGWGASAGAQSISLLNLMNLTSLSNQQAADDIAARKVFKLQYGEEVDGFLIEAYTTTAPSNKVETIIVGRGFKLASGGVLHTASYVSANTKDVIKLMAQAKGANLKQSFHGADNKDNIYIYDSILYHMMVRISLDGTRSAVDISEKQLFIE
ncbi:hypothetical protein [Mucilaginibacter sp. HD30]